MHTGTKADQNLRIYIRDADMAKELTDYTKNNNVLLQASASVLAQANQNSGSVLGLLK